MSLLVQRKFVIVLELQTKPKEKKKLMLKDVHVD